MKKLLKKGILSWLLIIYFIIWQISAIFFWYQYSLDHDFGETVFFGFFVGEFKGLLWIIFIW